MAELEQTHFVAGKVFVFQVPKLESSEGFKAASWPKTPLWTGQLRVVSRGDKVSVLLEHTDKGHSTAQHSTTQHKHISAALSPAPACSLPSLVHVLTSACVDDGRCVWRHCSEGLFAACPIQNDKTVEQSQLDLFTRSSRVRWPCAE